MVDDDGRTDGWTLDHGHPISSPCEPNGSGELKSVMTTSILIFAGIRYGIDNVHMSALEAIKSYFKSHNI